jgi:TM2 domain-containing membrane protein YozV
MDTQKVDNYLMMNGKYFESVHLPEIRNTLMGLTDDQFRNLSMIELKDPTTMLIISIFAGGLGIDRFMLGETGLGVAKLLTCGGLGVWSIIDLFLIMGRTREINLQRLQEAIAYA